MTAPLLDEDDRFDAARVQRAGGVLRTFNEAGVLGPADVHVAQRLGRLCDESDETALLAAALAVRAPRFGHVYADLARVRDTVVVDTDAAGSQVELPWPDAAAWADALAASPLVGPAEATPVGQHPLRLAGTRLYLDRYWVYEQQVLADIRERAGAPALPVDDAALQAGLARLFPPADAGPDLQRLAAATVARHRLTVIAGGPGTGKTTTVARVLALLAEQHPGDPPRVALAAPTGKAADRVQQAVHGSAGDLDVAGDVRTWLRGLEASTLHRLLGSRPGSTRFRHNRDNPLPYDVVVVDEASMVALALMARLLEAVGPDTRLVLLGDPDQLASVEAGAVLGDIVGPLRGAAGAGPDGEAPAEAGASGAPDGGPHASGWLFDPDAPPTATGPPAPRPVAAPAGSANPLAGTIAVLRRRHRFAEDSGIAALAEAIGRGDADAVLALLGDARPDVRFLPVLGDEAARESEALAPIRAAVVAAAAPVFEAARSGDAQAALERLGALRLLCAHRRGPVGVSAWVPALERWLTAAGFDLSTPWYPGRPVLVTRNDYQLNLRNGDVGVTVTDPAGEPTVAFAAPDGVRFVGPVRLEDHETVHAMTVHKSQGSQFGQAIVVLPEPDSPILTRELLYTAVTRAASAVTLVGSPDAVRAAVDRPVQRASGLREALWGP